MNQNDVSPNQEVGAVDEGMLDPFELRVLAVLAEKESLTPDSYPLSLNALSNGCNQLTSRDPIMSINEEHLREVLRSLIQKKLVTEVSQAGARVTKYEHRMRMQWSLTQDKAAILTVLALRGMQTPGEIRNRVGRLHQFSSAADVETGLQFLIDKYPPLVARLPRAPGAKESRYVHLLSGDVDLERYQAVSGFSPQESFEPGQPDRLRQLEQEVLQLRAEMDSLQQQFEGFKKQFD